jgi:hypothetical protein
MKPVSVLIVTLLMLAGCTSFSSTPITRIAGGVFSGDSNGHPKFRLGSRPHKGMPVRLKVQTHTDVYIKETLTYVSNAQGISQPFCSTRNLHVEVLPVITEQVVMVDFKRPASGTLGLDVELTDEEYFKKIHSKLEDTTIVESANLVNSILKATVAANEGAPKPKQVPAGFEEVVRTVAYQRFDVSAADYEDQLEAFVNNHLNDCHQCAGPPRYDATIIPN